MSLCLFYLLLSQIGLGMSMVSSYGINVLLKKNQSKTEFGKLMGSSTSMFKLECYHHHIRVTATSREQVALRKMTRKKKHKSIQFDIKFLLKIYFNKAVN